MKKLITKLLKYKHKIKVNLYKNFLSDIRVFKGRPQINVPYLFLGTGEINIDDSVSLGYFPSPYFYDGSNHIEARNYDAKINIAKSTIINNNFTAISEGAGISIGQDCLIGLNVSIIDSDFHSITLERQKDVKKAPVHIGNNVWIGNNVTILKGVTIGDNCTIATGSIVTKSFKPNSIIGGNPAKFIKSIPLTADN